MKKTLLLALIAGLGPSVVAAQPAFGTMAEYQVGNDLIAAQIWSLDDYLIVARVADEVGKGGFPADVASTVGRAFLDGHGMQRCTIKNVGLKYSNVPGVYQVSYRC